MKNFKQLPTEGFLCNFSWTQRQVFCSDSAQKNSRTYKIFAQNWFDKSRALLKNQNFEILNNEICSIFHIDYLVFYFWIKLLIFWEKRIDSGPIFHMSQSFFGPNHYKKPAFMSMRNYKEILLSEVA